MSQSSMLAITPREHTPSLNVRILRFYNQKSVLP